MSEEIKRNDGVEKLAEIFLSIQDKGDMVSFFKEIFTEKELKDFSNRWLLLEKLKDGDTHRDISKNLGISLCKITRGSKILKDNSSTINKILNR